MCVDEVTHIRGYVQRLFSLINIILQYRQHPREHPKYDKKKKARKLEISVRRFVLVFTYLPFSIKTKTQKILTEYSIYRFNYCSYHTMAAIIDLLSL